MLITFSMLNWFLGFGALVLEVGALLLLVLFFLRHKNEVAGEIVAFFRTFALWIGFLLVLISMSMSLYYSEVLGFKPCGLCWSIRVFSYPLVFLFALALWKKDTSIADYVITLSIPGAIVSLYQHYLQMGGAEFINCSTVSVGTDCAERFFFAWGHITFPWIAFTLFVFLVVLMIIVRRK